MLGSPTMFRSSSTKPPAKKKSVDPPVLVAQKFRAAIASDSPQAESAMYATLDLSAALSTPMAIIYSRNRIRKWLAFDRRVINSVGATLEFDEKGENTSIVVDSESGRSVTSTYRIAALEFTEHFSLNNVLMVRSVKRTMRRVAARSERERRMTDALLLQWCGPHFVGYCTAQTTVGCRIDNRAISLPVLDFSFSQLQSVRGMLDKQPRDGRELRDKNVYLHFLAYAEAQQRAEQERAIKQQEEEERNSRGGGGVAANRRDDVIIKAKNRVGDEDHIVIDKNELIRGSKGSASLDARIELLEDAESVIRDDTPRFACSGLKLNNNALTDATELEMVCRLRIMNAFYFLSWVDLASNQITAVPDLSPFPIVSLYLHDNRIASLDSVKQLQHMKLLQNLTLFGNPLQSDVPAKYKLPVLSLLLVPDEVAIQRQHEEQERKKREAGVLRQAMERIRLETMPAAKRATSPLASNNNNRSASRAGAAARSSSTPPAPAAASSQRRAVVPTAAAAAAASPVALQSKATAVASSGASPAKSSVTMQRADENDGEEGAAAVVLSPTRQRYFPDLHAAAPPPPPPPPPVLKLKTLDHGLITPEDRKALYTWIDLYTPKPVKKKRGH